jgi:hypothetical protein
MNSIISLFIELGDSLTMNAGPGELAVGYNHRLAKPARSGQAMTDRRAAGHGLRSGSC